MKPRWLGLASLAILIWSNPAAAATRVCVSVQQKSWYRPPAAPHVAVPAATDGDRPPAPPPAAPPPPSPPPPAGGDSTTQAHPAAHEIDPTLYLKRMLEYEVTHENGFLAVGDGCQQHLVVELYQLESGWTVFGHFGEREEKVDRAELDE